jgi:molybdopterin-binding protein
MVAAGKGGASVTVSARNQLKGKVTEVKLGTIMAEVVVDIGGHHVVAAITRGSADGMAIHAGDSVTVVIKSTDVMIEK